MAYEKERCPTQSHDESPHTNKKLRKAKGQYKKRHNRHHNTNIQGDKNSISKIYMKTSAREGYALSTWKLARVLRLKESRLTIRKDEDQGLVPSEEV